MKVRKYKKDGSPAGEIELPASLFHEEISKGAIYDAIKEENANLRQGTHSTKDRSEVSGGGKKPWAQKGTGRARQGSIRAPHWVGGGIIHGPKPRDYSGSLSRNIKRKAVTSILNWKAKEGRLLVLEDLELDTFSTKRVSQVLDKMELSQKGKLGLVVSGESIHLKRSTRNIPFLKYVNSKRMVCRDILFNQNLVITEKALNELVQQYGKGSKA